MGTGKRHRPTDWLAPVCFAFLLNIPPSSSFGNLETEFTLYEVLYSKLKETERGKNGYWEVKSKKNIGKKIFIYISVMQSFLILQTKFYVNAPVQVFVKEGEKSRIANRKQWDINAKTLKKQSFLELIILILKSTRNTSNHLWKTPRHKRTIKKKKSRALQLSFSYTPFESSNTPWPTHLYNIGWLPHTARIFTFLTVTSSLSTHTVKCMCTQQPKGRKGPRFSFPSAFKHQYPLLEEHRWSVADLLSKKVACRANIWGAEKLCRKCSTGRTPYWGPNS